MWCRLRLAFQLSADPLMPEAKLSVGLSWSRKVLVPEALARGLSLAEKPAKICPHLKLPLSDVF
jgi:hypothetical protein